MEWFVEPAEPFFCPLFALIAWAAAIAAFFGFPPFLCAAEAAAVMAWVLLANILELSIFDLV